MDAVEGSKTVILLPFAKNREENHWALPYILMEIETWTPQKAKEQNHGSSN